MNRQSEPTTMEKLRGPLILERGERFLSVWKHQAPEQERFAGIDYQELHAEVAAALPPETGRADRRGRPTHRP